MDGGHFSRGMRHIEWTSLLILAAQHRCNAHNENFNVLLKIEPQVMRAVFQKPQDLASFLKIVYDIRYILATNHFFFCKLVKIR